MNANCVGSEANVTLERRRGFEVDGPAGTTVRVTHGEVWITRHRDTEDHLLTAGDVLEHAGKGKTLVTAMKDAQIQIRHPRPKPALWASLRRLFHVASMKG